MAGRTGDRIPVRDEIFRTRPYQIWGPTQPPTQWVPGFPRGKVAGAWRWPPTPSSAEVKERVDLYLYSPSGLSLALPHFTFTIQHIHGGRTSHCWLHANQFYCTVVLSLLSQDFFLKANWPSDFNVFGTGDESQKSLHPEELKYKMYILLLFNSLRSIRWRS